MSSDAPDISNYEDLFFYSQYKLEGYRNLIVGIVCGVYLVFYFTSIHILMSKPGFTSSRPKMFMFGITTFMFVLGIVALVLETALGFQKFLDSDTTTDSGWSDHSTYRTDVLSAVKTTIARLMYILSDIICAWRAVVLWNRNKRVIMTLLLFVIVTTAFTVCDLVLYFIILFGPPRDLLSTEWKDNYIRLIMMFGPILGTNVLSTGLIAWKAWQHRSSVRKHLGEGSGSVRVERVFALLIESGIVYCCLWIVYLISVFHVMSEPAFKVAEDTLLFVSGLYPTFIVVLVGMQKSPIEHYSTFSTGMQFANGPAPGPPRAGGMPRHLNANWRESASNPNTPVTSVVFRETSDEEKPENL